MHATAITPTSSTAALVRDSYLAAYAGETLRVYSHYINEWLAWCNDQGIDPIDATRLHVELYIRHRLDVVGNKPSTVQASLTAVKGYYRLAVGDGIIARNPVEFARRLRINFDASSRKWLSRVEMNRFLHAARQTSPRHDATAHLLAVLGLRASEVGSVDIEDYQHQIGGYPVLRLTGKGLRDASLPLPVPVLRSLDRCRGDRTSGPLVLTLDGRRANRHTVAGLVETICRRAGLEPVRPHTLRRSAITAALDSGVPLRDVQHFARHARPDTTMHYDRGQSNLDRHAAHVLSAFIAN